MWSGWCGCLYECENGNGCCIHSPKYSSEGGLSMSNNIFLVRRSSSSSGWATEAPVWGRGNNKAIRGRVFNPLFSWILPLLPLTYLRNCKKKMLMLGKKKYTDFRRKRFAKIQLQQIRTKPARSSERPSSLKNMQWWASVSPCPQRDLTLARAPVVEHILLYYTNM